MLLLSLNYPRAISKKTAALKYAVHANSRKLEVAEGHTQVEEKTFAQATLLLLPTSRGDINS
ncbi:hypothetical protein LC593_25550 [Nostoc sp. CHAB 5844]|nr:hypothetical protein [Nostoc sp. CHAB 5844]